jgi:hypothetical protein
MPVYRGKLYPDLNGFEGWMDERIDFQWISHLFSKPLCVDYTSHESDF